MRRGSPDYTNVIRTIEHYLQYGSGHHPHASHEEAAREMASGDAQRALQEIGAMLDQAKRE